MLSVLYTGMGFIKIKRRILFFLKKEGFVGCLLVYYF
jgi:hypothetical protein